MAAKPIIISWFLRTQTVVDALKADWKLSARQLKFHVLVEYEKLESQVCVVDGDIQWHVYDANHLGDVLDEIEKIHGELCIPFRDNQNQPVVTIAHSRGADYSEYGMFKSGKLWNFIPQTHRRKSTVAKKEKAKVNKKSKAKATETQEQLYVFPEKARSVEDVAHILMLMFAKMDPADGMMRISFEDLKSIFAVKKFDEECLEQLTAALSSADDSVCTAFSKKEGGIGDTLTITPLFLMEKVEGEKQEVPYFVIAPSKLMKKTSKKVTSKLVKAAIEDADSLFPEGAQARVVEMMEEPHTRAAAKKTKKKKADKEEKSSKKADKKSKKDKGEKSAKKDKKKSADKADKKSKKDKKDKTKKSKKSKK